MANSEFVAGLRALADWYEAHADARLPHATEIGVYPEDTKDEVRRWARALGAFNKEGDDSFIKLTKTFGPVKLKVVFWRNAVCERRVVGTKKITERVPDPNAPKIAAEIPDPDAPLVEVERDEEIVEWDCPPLLASEEAAA